jgi:hypothetical protein
VGRYAGSPITATMSAFVCRECRLRVYSRMVKVYDLLCGSVYANRLKKLRKLPVIEIQGSDVVAYKSFPNVTGLQHRFLLRHIPCHPVDVAL